MLIKWATGGTVLKCWARFILIVVDINDFCGILRINNQSGTLSTKHTEHTPLTNQSNDIYVHGYIEGYIQIALN